jgi:hypothetical protein
MNQTRIIVLAVIIAGVSLWFPANVNAYKETATSYQDGYDKGYNDATGGFSYYVEHGHSGTYKSGYQDGYRAGIAYSKSGGTTDGSNNDNGNTDASQAGSQDATQSIGGNDVAVKGDNNRVTINQLQNQEQNQAQAQDNGEQTGYVRIPIIHDDNSQYDTYQSQQHYVIPKVGDQVQNPSCDIICVSIK